MDFVILDEKNELVTPAISYRDERTIGMEEFVDKIIPFEQLYEQTGIQRQIFNTIYQLTALKKDNPNALQRGKNFLMLPDYFHFLLTGIVVNEYTEASTSSLVNAEGKNWDWDLIKSLGLPTEIFSNLTVPGVVLGRFTDDVREKVGFDCDVTLPPSHDTASAYLAVPTTAQDAIYISSGTWSLMGIESAVPITSQYARDGNFTNEGGYAYRFRFLKNIMGLWMIQSVRKETGEKYSFPELSNMAKESGPPVAIVNVDDRAFFAPESMITAVKETAKRTGQTVPESLGQVVQCIYHSLAQCYADTAKQLERATGRKYSTLHTFGGGSQDNYLNQLTAKATGLKVFAGPTEATAIGSIIVQMMAKGELGSLEEGKKLIEDSFPITEVV